MKTLKQNVNIRQGIVLLAIFFAFTYKANATAYVWVGGHSGDATSWNQQLNWNPSSAIPGSGDDVTISSGGTNDPTMDVSGGTTINSLTINTAGTILTLDGTNNLTVNNN